MGFWFSVPSEHDWPAWCISEDFFVEKLRWRHVYELNTANVLVLNNIDDMADFNAAWGSKISTIQSHIRWKSLAQKYKGLLIPNYLWECRLELEFEWYYTWDCSSGVFWDMSCLTWIKTEETDLWKANQLR